MVYNESGWNDYYADIELTQRFRVEGNALYWTIHPRNLTHKPLLLGDVILSLPFNTEKRWNKEITYTQRVHQHRFVSGHNSFLDAAQQRRSIFGDGACFHLPPF